MVKRTGWTLEHIDDLPMKELFDFLEVDSAIDKAYATVQREAAQKARRGRR